MSLNPGRPHQSHLGLGSLFYSLSVSVYLPVCLSVCVSVPVCLYSTHLPICARLGNRVIYIPIVKTSGLTNKCLFFLLGGEASFASYPEMPSYFGAPLWAPFARGAGCCGHRGPGRSGLQCLWGADPAVTFLVVFFRFFPQIFKGIFYSLFLMTINKCFHYGKES